jgi:periplasmic protein TonB
MHRFILALMRAALSNLVSLITRRGTFGVLIAAVHIGVIYAVTSWSPVRAVIETTPIEASIVEMPTPPSEALPPLQPPVVTPTLPVIEQPLIVLTEEPPVNAITVAVAETPPPPPAPMAAAPRVVTDVAYVEPPQPRYPQESKRSGEEGLVVLRVLINELGKAARIDIERSSGHARLDEAARQAVQRALFRPYVENGVARMALATIPIEFTWKSRRASKSASRG